MKKYKGFQKLDHKISKIIKPISKKKRDNFAVLTKLSKNWQQIIGDKYYQYCYPKKIKFNQDGKAILFIGAYNSAVAFALEGNQNYIIEKIASYFGYKIISNVKISQELKEISLKKEEKKIELNEKDQQLITTSTNKIKNTNLKNTLKKLGESIFNKNSD